jgi:hypothetical protein
VVFYNSTLIALNTLLGEGENSEINWYCDAGIFAVNCELFTILEWNY